ncbi:MAG: NADH:flavin oxidoreductase/NADH oxidase [Rhodomicrobiaceae bacterium]
MSHLFQSYQLRDVHFKNRIVVSPMSQYRAKNGFANDWHMVHLGRFALGGAGLVFVEATAVEERGLRTHGDLGIWQDEQINELRRITSFLEAEGSVPGIQLAHAGRKASERRPWHNEQSLDAEDFELRSESPWEAIAPSPLPYADGWTEPTEMSVGDIEEVINAFGDAARRSKEAGFKVIEVYAAHGFLVHQFLSPLTNQRSDEWGGNERKRRRFAIEVARSIRKNWPKNLPLIFRLSATDWIDGGIEIEDTIETAKCLSLEGVDMIDCSTGGIGGKDRPRRMKVSQGFQVEFAKRLKEEANIETMAVGFLWEPEFCEAIVQKKEADMVALARELLDDPNWPLHAASQLGADKDYGLWPEEMGWWLGKRDRFLKKLGIR